MNLKEDELEFIKKYTKTIALHYNEIIDLIKINIDKWDLFRINAVERVLLIIATYEIMENNNINYKISINEAVKLAKKYGDIKSFEFLNGVLAKIIKYLTQNNMIQN